MQMRPEDSPPVIIPSAYANGSPVFHSRTPALHHTLPYAEPITLKLIDRVFFVFFMPPPSTPADYSRMPNSISSDGYTQWPKIFLLVLVVTTGIRMAVLHCARKKRRIAAASQHVQEEKDSTSCQAPSEKDLRQDGCPQSKDQPPPTFRPIYPWISAPQPLPGPYDPRFYPLPTIRRHSYDPSHGPSPEAEAHTISYTRRVSTNSLPTRHPTLHGKVTTTSNSTAGWRRNQWVVSGG